MTNDLRKLAEAATPGKVSQFPAKGFARGSVVRKFGQGPNLLVVRQLDCTTVVVIVEGDEGGNLRLREYQTGDLEQTLADHGRQDHEFDLRWQADRRAIERWRGKHPGKELTWPDHVDLVIWLGEEYAARVAELEGQREVDRGLANGRNAVIKQLDACVAELEAENKRLNAMAKPCLSKKARASLGEMCEAMEAMDDDTTDSTALRLLLEWHDRRAAAAMEGK